MNELAAPLNRTAWQRGVTRAVALALLCALLQALLPRYTLGATTLAPLSVVLGVAVAAAMSRGRWTVPSALAGVLVADLLMGDPMQSALIGAGVMGLQALVVGWLMRHADDPDLLQLDTEARLKRFLLLATPAAAMVGVLAGMLAQWGVDAARSVPLVAPQLASALGRFIADSAGIMVTAPVLLCWLAQPQVAWRPRRRLVALPLLAVVAVVLPGFDQIARRDELRLQTRFDREASLRRVRVQQGLSDPLDAVLALRGVLAVGGQKIDTSLFDPLSAGWMERVPGLRSTGWLERTNAADGSASVQLRHSHASKTGEAPLPGARTTPDGKLSLTPALRQALDRAWTSPGAVLATLPNDGEGNAGTALVVMQAVPASSAPALRVVFATVDVTGLLAGAMPDDDDPNLRACLTSSAGATVEPGQRPRRLAGPRGCEGDVLASALRAVPSKINVGEARFDLLVTEPATADNRLFTAVWLLALPAVIGTALLSALLLAISGRLRRIEDRVRERTAALQAEIDERRQAEERLAVREQRFRAIFDSVNIGVTVVDPQGLVVDVNPAFCTMMGATAAQLLQRPLADIRLPDVNEDDGTAVALGGGQARRQRFLTHDGRVLQVAASLRTLRDATGQAVATVGALQDLTQVLRLREAEREREQAEMASRTKSDFMARLSHELRAPLNAILGFAQKLGQADAGGELDDANRHRSLAQIRQAGWHLLDMVNDVLDLSRMEAGSLRLTLEPVSLADLAQEAMAMVEAAAQQGQVAMRLSLSPQADSVQADPVRLRQIVINLLGNAIKYNRPGGRVVLRTRPAGVGEVVIEVEDDGIGMSEAQLGELFTPFNRLGREQPDAAGKPGSHGTGIGLVICRKLADLMAGELSVSSTEGAGSLFSLRLPRPVGEPTRVIVTSTMPLMPNISIGTVLYIEDNDADRQSMRDLLAQRPGITLMSAPSAAQGLALAAEADLVLLDLDLPDQPGLAVLQALKADTRLRNTPVIVVSAESRPQRIDECFDAGAAQFLTKPLDPKPTLRAIDDSLGAH